MPGPGNRPETPRIYSQTPGPGMVPVYSGVGRDGKPTGLLGYEPDLSGGIVEVPKPSEVIALEKKIGTTLEPFYSQGNAPHGGVRDSGPPIGYRYDNGQSQYVNYDTSGNYQSTQDRNNSLLPMLAILAMPFVGPALFEAMGLGAGAGAAGAGAGGAGLLAGEGTIAALPLSQLAAEGLTAGGAGALGMGGGTGLTATLGTDLAAGGLLTAGNTGLAAMGGAAGLTALPSLSPFAGAPLAAAGTGLASMGGGTGLTTAAAGGGTVGAGGVTSAPALPLDGATPPMPATPTAAPPVEPSKLPSWVTPTNALLAASALSSIAKANETTPTAAPFTMAPYVPPSGKPFANLGMSPIATPYTPTRILGQYDPTMTPGGVSPYELIMAQMQAPKNLYADFEAGTNIGGFDPQRFVTPAAENYKGGMIDKSRMVGPNPMGPDNGFASIQDGEFVMNRKATQKYGIELMNAINSGKISKGKLSGLLEA